MNRSRQCVLCGVTGGCGVMVMGQFVCLGCQRLLEDPKKRVFGCGNNLRISGGKSEKHMELAKARE